jgi:hypothetical protein
MAIAAIAMFELRRMDRAFATEEASVRVIFRLR